MPRLSNWTAPLIEYLAAAARRPFKPGHHDCALFAAGAVAAMTGTDFAAQWRGRYTTLRGGLRVIRRAGATPEAPATPVYDDSMRNRPLLYERA